MMKFKDLQKRAICMFLALLMVFTTVPVNTFVITAHAAQEDGLCAHHTAHNGCGYAEAVAEQPCGYECEECKAEAALENVVALFAALPEAGSITAETTDAEKDAVFAQLEVAMAAYDALLEDYPEQAASFEETQLQLIQKAFALNDALTGNTAQTYAHQSYDPNSWYNVTITIRDESRNAITGAQVTVSSGNDTYEVRETGNGQYKFTRNSNTKSYTVSVSAEGYETKTETQRISNNAISITLEEVEDLTQENLKTFKVFYIATGKIPSSYAGAGDSKDYGPSGNDTPLVRITVDINKLRREYSDVVRYDTNTSSNHWEFTPNGPAQNMAATQAFWEAVWECMTDDSREAFEDTGFANDFYGYVLKQQKSDSSQHCDGVLTKTPPVYVTELHENNVYFGGTVTDGGDAFKTIADIQQMYEDRLGVDIVWTSKTTGTYFSGGRIYTVTLTQTNATSAQNIPGSEIRYESKNSTNTYYLATFNLTTAEGADGYYAVIYTDGENYETIFDNQLTTVQEGSKAPAFNGTPQREGYIFKGWRQEGVSGLLTDAQIAEMTVSSNLTFHAIWEPIPTSFTGTVNVRLNDTYPADITGLMDADTKLYVRKTSSSYIQLEKTGVGVYGAELENGVWNLYYSNDGANYTLVDDGALVINNAPASRDLDFYSVSYELDGGAVTPQIPVSYYIRGSQVAVTAAVPTKANYRFTGWKSSETLYQPKTNLTGSINNAYTLVAQWEKTVNVTVNVTIIHENEDGFADPETTKADVYLELVSKANATAAYLETGNDLTLNDSNHDGFTHTTGDIEGVLTTLYTAEDVIFADMPGGTTEYSVVTSKTSYDTDVTTSQDADGNWIINVRMEFNPTNFDLAFSVNVDDSVPEAYLPKAAIVKVTFWNGTEWKVITQHTDGAPGVRVNIDSNTYSGSGSYPVWKSVSGSTVPYGYRIIVTAFVYPDGTIVPTREAEADIKWGDGVYLATMDAVSGGQVFGSLDGAYYDAGTNDQIGTLSAHITMDLYNVTFNAMGGTIDGQNEKTVEKQYRVPSLSNYKPVRDGGYIFEGWYTKDGTNSDWGNKATSHKDLTGDITLYAKWREPIKVTGTVYVAGSYELSGNTHIIHDEDRAQTVMILLRKQGSNGVYGTDEVNITYGADHIGVGTYEFTGLADDGTVYYIEESTANYDGVYLNEPKSLNDTFTTNFDAYSASDNVAVLYDENKIAQVNSYLPFNPASFDLNYSVDATAIGSTFRPTTVKMLVTYDADHTISAPENWPVISQMVFGTAHNGNVITLSEGKGNGSTSVWSSFPNGTTLYDYGIRVDEVTGPNLNDYADAPYSITYQAPAHQVSGGQSKALVATLTPKDYTITYELDVDSTAVTGMNTAPKKHTWSYDTDLSGVTPRRNGYEFLGWYDDASCTGQPVTKIDAAVAKDVTLYAKWYQMMDDVDLTVTVIHKTPDGSGEAGNYDKDMLVQLTRAAESSSNYEAVPGQQKNYDKDVWHTLGDDADKEILSVPHIFKGLAYDYAYNLNVSLDGYYVTEKTVTTVVDSLTGATTYQVAVTLQYNPDLLNFSFGVEMAPGIDKSLWPESAEVRVTCWYDHPSEEIGLAWNTITQHESRSVTVTLDDTGKGTGSYPVWQWLDKGAEEPYYYRIEVISLRLSDGSVVMTDGTDNVVYSGGDYSATIATENCATPINPGLAGAYGQSVSGGYIQCGDVKAVISIDRWKDDSNNPAGDNETDGDGIYDHQQALILFRSADETMGTVSGNTTQVYTLTKNGNRYSLEVAPAIVTATAKTTAGYVFSHWTNAAGETVNPFLKQTVQGGQTYVYTANWKLNDSRSYKVKYLEKDTNEVLATEKTVDNITYGTQINAEKEKIAISNYVFDHASADTITIGMNENVLTLYYAKDDLDDAGDKTDGGDGIADYKQAVIRFVSGPNGTVSGTTTQVFTLDKNGSSYSGTVVPAEVVTTAATGYKFSHWEKENTEVNPYQSTLLSGGQKITYIAQFVKDSFGYRVEYYYDGVLTNTVDGAKTVFGTNVSVNPATSDGDYMLDKVEPESKMLQISAVEENNVIRIYYVTDVWKDDSQTGNDSSSGGDGIPDYRQVLVTFVPGDSYGTVTGAGATQVFTFAANTASGNVKPVLTNVVTTGNEGYAFDYWTQDNLPQQVNPGATLTNVPAGTEIVFKAHFAEDAWKDAEKTSDSNDSDSKTGGDNIPDKYQAVVTYLIENGTWKDSTNIPIINVFTLYSWDSEDCCWNQQNVTLGDTVPKEMNPIAGYTASGYWEQESTADDPTSTTLVTQNATYTYWYDKLATFHIVVTVENGQVDPNQTAFHVVYGADQELSFAPDAGYALDSVTVDGADATLTDGKYIFEDVATNHSIHVVYSKDSWKDSEKTPGSDTDGETEGDGIPDNQQAIVRFVAGPNGIIEGTALYVITLTKNSGAYTGTFRADVNTVSAKGNPGYNFSHWENNANPYQEITLTGGQEITYIAQFAKANFGYRIEYYYNGTLKRTDASATAEFESVVTINPALRDGDYMLEKVEPASKSLQISADEAKNVIKVYYVTDLWNDANDTQTGGDRIPDYRQVLVTFVSGDSNGTVTGDGTTQVFTLAEGAASGDVTPDLTGVVAKGVTDYTLDYWTEDDLLQQVDPGATRTNVSGGTSIVFKAHFAKDVWKDAEKTPDDDDDSKTGGDNIPDYQQAIIKFDSGLNGAVEGKTTQIFTLKKSGNYYGDIVVPATVTTKPNTGYKFSHWKNGTQEVNPYHPTVLSGGQEITYTAQFAKESFGYRVEYYYDGVLDSSKTETGTKEFEAFVFVEPDRDGDYMLEKVEPASKSMQISADEAKNVIKVYYVTDLWNDANDTQTGGDNTPGDGIPDHQQVLVTFVPGDSNGTVTGDGTTQVFTLAAGATSGAVTPDLTEVVAKGNEGYAFDYWTRGNLLWQVNPGATRNVSGGTSIVFKAHFAKDTWKDSVKTPADDTDSQTGGDNIPDKYQAVVTYFVENGTWSNGTDTQIAEVFTLYSWDPADCSWNKQNVTLGDTVPKDMKPAAGYTTPGYWGQKDTVEDNPTSATQVTQNETYTYCYGERMKFNVAVTVENGQVIPDKTTVQVIYGEDQTLSFQPDTGYALDSVTVDGIKAVLMDGSYTFEDVTADHSIHIVYSKDSWKDSEWTLEEDKDSEDGGDGIPDCRQAVVAFAADSNGTIEGTSRYVITLPETDGVYKGQFCAEKTEVSAKANEGYKFTKWILAQETLVRTTPAEAADPYVPMDILGGNYYLYTAQFAEDTCDVTYPEKDADAATTVPVQSAKYIQIKPNGGFWQNSKEAQLVQITGDYTVVDPVRSGYLFMGWVCNEGTEKDVVYVLTAQWEKDEAGKIDADGKDIPDGIPDKYQKKVIFKIENGYWQQGADADLILWLTLADEQGNWDVNGSAKLEIPTGMYAKSGYENGKWDATPPALVKGTATETFAYRFNQIPVNEQNPDTGDRSAEILWIYVTGMLMSAAALILLASYRREKRKTR